MGTAGFEGTVRRRCAIEHRTGTGVAVIIFKEMSFGFHILQLTWPSFL